MRFTALLFTSSLLLIGCAANPLNNLKKRIQGVLLDRLHVEEKEAENQLLGLLNTEEQVLSFALRQSCGSANCVNGDCVQGITTSFCVCDNGWSGDSCDVEGNVNGFLYVIFKLKSWATS